MAVPGRRKPPTRRRLRAKDCERAPATALVKREAGALSKKGPGTVQQSARETVINSDLHLLLKAHGLQSSQIADQLAKQESAMIQFTGADQGGDRGKLLAITSRLEAIRRSATEDLRLTIRTLEELKYPPVALAAVLGDDQRAFYASGSSKVFAGRAGKDEG